MKKKYLILTLILIVIISVVSVFIYGYLKNKNENENKVIDIDKRISEIITDSYTYYLLLNGNIPLEDEEISFSEDDSVRYRLVSLDNITSINDITDLVNRLFIKDVRDDRLNDIYSTDRKYVETQDRLYVNYNEDEICDLSLVEDIKNYTYTKLEDDTIMISTTLGDTIVVYENDNWYLQFSNIYNCNKEVIK